MAEELNQQTGVARLARVNPLYAQALSGQNPVPQVQPPKPKQRLVITSALFMYLIPILFFVCWVWVVGMASATNTDAPGQAIIGVAFASGFFLLIFAAISYATGAFIRSETNPPPPAPQPPILYTLHPVTTEFLKQYLGNEIILTLRYDIPVDSHQSASGPLNKLLTLETDELIDRFIEQSETIYLHADDNEQVRLRAAGHLKLNTDLIEYQLVPQFGRAVYESKIPVFRFKITAKTPRAVLEHDIEVGDIIDGNL